MRYETDGDLEFQLDKHTGKVGYEYITKILKEILN